MSFEKIVKTLVGDSPGKTTELTYFRIGPNSAEKKVYLQAALHADEQPGILILHHLLELLRVADEAGELGAQFVLFPMVNPLGMGDIEFGQHQGRYDRDSGVNHNRQWPDLFGTLGQDLKGRLGNDEQKNIQLVREAIANWLNKYPKIKARDQWRHAVMSEAFDADYVFDLHCDDESLLYIYSVPQQKEPLQRLANYTGAVATLLAEDGGGNSFDEVWSAIWINLAKACPDKNISHPVRSCTLEYRGQTDTFDGINLQDAENLYGYFQAEGLIGGAVRGKSIQAPDATDLRAMEIVRAEHTGLLAYCVELGDRVETGQKIADLIQLDGEQAFVKRTPVLAGTCGLILSRNTNKYVWRGAGITKIVGTEILESRGEFLLED
ncbi:MAG: succinylglutamate desuccinylase/aspartoacylase family protein [Gammaproteobacteria bacterium]|nr:succinylglutamate desuccinylase/aspartoacylase family protein [Gammaproteobacteria bacterium]